MKTNIKGRRKPGIVICRTEHQRLTNLATAVADRAPEVSEELLAELDRARIVDDGRVPEDVVRIGSTVRYKTDAGETRTVTLVFPGDADISAGRISILTPIGVALLGLSTGQSMVWTARDGREHELTVQAVDQAPPPLADRGGSAPETANVTTGR